MRKMYFAISTLVLFLSMNLFAADKSLVCLASSSADLTAPVEDSGAYLAVYAQIGENLVLKNVMIEDYPGSNDNETIHQQERVVGQQAADSQISYTLSNGSQLLLPENITNISSCAGLLKNLNRFGGINILLRCKISQ